MSIILTMEFDVPDCEDEISAAEIYGQNFMTDPSWFVKSLGEQPNDYLRLDVGKIEAE